MLPLSLSSPLPPPPPPTALPPLTKTHSRIHIPSSVVSTTWLLVLFPLLLVSAVVLLKHAHYMPLFTLLPPPSAPLLLKWDDKSYDAAVAPIAPATIQATAAAVPAPSPISVSTSSVNPAPGTERSASLETLESGLARSRSTIRSAKYSNKKSIDYVPVGPAYRNAYAFYRSYLEMEKLFRVYIYEEGQPPLFHDGPCKSTYSTEGRFIYNMEADTHFRTRDPEKAHAFFLPFSVSKMVKYQRKDFDISSVHITIRDYIHVIGERHPFWNRSLGADHFMISCHDWGPKATAAYSHLFTNSIRVLCNANTSEGFDPSKDVSLPEMNLRTDKTADIIGWSSPSNRSHLAFFAGRLHGNIREILLKHWVGKDEDILIYQHLPAGISYYNMMNSSKFCICPSGFEVASPRIVEAIYLGCVPVIISNNYILPFSDVLNWGAFSVLVTVTEIPNLKNILMSITPSRYESMRSMLKVVQRHFAVRTPPQRFDMFHMVLHSIWLRRLNVHVVGRH